MRARARILAVAADGRADVPGRGLGDEVRPELVQHRGGRPAQLARGIVLLLDAQGLQRIGLGARVGFLGQQVGPIRQVEAKVHQDAHRDALAFLEEGQQQVIFLDFVLIFVVGGVDRQGKDDPRAGRQGNRIAGHVPAAPHGFPDCIAHDGGFEVGAAQQAVSAPVFEFGQDVKEVLGADEVLAQADGLFRSQVQQIAAAFANFLLTDFKGRRHSFVLNRLSGGEPLMIRVEYTASRDHSQ